MYTDDHEREPEVKHEQQEDQQQEESHERKEFVAQKEQKRFPEDLHGKERKLRDNWRNRMNSTWIRMSRGAQNFWRSLSWPHNDNWRRKNKKK